MRIAIVRLRNFYDEANCSIDCVHSVFTSRSSMPRSTVSEEGSEVDRGSVCSTIASTASLSSRIANLALDFEDKFRHAHHDPADFPPVFEGEEGIESEEEAIEISEEQLMQELDSMEPSLQVLAWSLHFGEPRYHSCPVIYISDMSSLVQLQDHLA